MTTIDTALAPGDDRPNIVLIMADDMSRKNFGFLGGDVLTPTLDKLADEGVYFRQAHVPSALCSPSRYSLLTGQDPSRAAIVREFDHGQRFWRQFSFSPDEAVTIGEMLQDSGYRTGLVGKIHAKRHQANSSYEHLLETVKAYGFDYSASLYPSNYYQYHNQDWIAAGALGFIEQSHTQGQQPFFLYLSTTLLHNPRPTAEMGGLGDAPNWQKNVLTWTPAKERGETDPNAQIHFDEVKANREAIRERVLAAGKPLESASTTWLDDGLAQVLQKLEELDIAENTVVIYLNDNGKEGGKASVYEAGTNVPLMIYWKGKTERLQDSDVYAQSYDIVPTILELARERPPAGVRLDGQSLVPILEGQQKIQGRDYAYTAIGHTRSITKDGWKYVAFRLPEGIPNPGDTSPLNQSIAALEKSLKTNQNLGLLEEPGIYRQHYQHYLDADQLYNLTTDFRDFDNAGSPNYDPIEEVNLASNSEYRAKQIELQSLLAQHLIDLPGSFGEFKFEVNLSADWQVKGNLNLSAPYNAIAVEDGLNPTANEYVVMEYAGQLFGEFEFDSAIRDLGYRVDYSIPGQIRLVKLSIEDEELVGGADNDTLTGGPGHDRLSGLNGNDTLNGGNGHDLLYGDRNNDLLNGGAGRDRLRGMMGNDTLYGGDSNDLLNGGADNDTLTGGLGRDTLYGGGGRDILSGGENRDTLSGGFGEDTFVYTARADGDDTIRDFQVGKDRIDLDGLFENLNIRVAHYGRAISQGFLKLTRQGSSTLVQIDPDGASGNQNSFELVNVKNVVLSALNEGSNFVF